MFRPSRARRALLLVAFSVLASTATAHAECVWVLWEQPAKSPANWSPWSQMSYYENKNLNRTRFLWTPSGLR